MMPAVFHQFGRLPVELQRMIWEEVYYLSMPQVIEGRIRERFIDGSQRSDAHTEGHIDFSEEDEINGSNGNVRPASANMNTPVPLLTFPWAARQAPTPALLHVCESSREVALRLGGFSTLWREPNDPAPKPVWFDFKSDIFCLTHLDINFSPSLGNRGDCASIRHVAVNWAFFHKGGWGLAHDEHQMHWITLVSELYMSFPALTDLYFFVPAVRLKQNAFMATVGVHFEEPGHCSGRPIILKPVTAASEEVFLPECGCVESRRSWIEASAGIEAAFRSEWLKDSVKEKLGDQHPLANFPPRIHHRIFLRKGLRLDWLPNEVAGRKVDVDKSLFQAGEERET